MSHKQNDTYNEYMMENIGGDNMLTKKTIPQKKILLNRNMPEPVPDRLEENEDDLNDGINFGFCVLMLLIILIGGCLLARPGHAGINLQAIAMIESGGNPKAIGDNGKALGMYQIHKALVIDYNRSQMGKNASHKHFTHKDMLDPIKAHKVAKWAFERYYPSILRRAGKAVTVKNLIICYNAGQGNAIKGRIPSGTKNYIKKYELMVKGE